MGRDFHPCRPRIYRQFQSTRPCGARPSTPKKSCGIKVSIHAPVWGATRDDDPRQQPCGFNPRARVGRDGCGIGDTPQEAVSIHAPVWGATPALWQAWPGLFCFNPRARVGRDTALGQAWPGLFCFNPRARVGRDSDVAMSEPARMFQSTRPCGARPQPIGPSCHLLVSIHAPVWGATERLREARMRPKFQSTRPCGARHEVTFTSAVCILCFNPRARVGRDRNLCVCRRKTCCFNPRARVGRDLPHYWHCLHAHCFNPRARVGRDLSASSQLLSDEFQSTRPCGARHTH